jgi:hypothetical protein
VRNGSYCVPEREVRGERPGPRPSGRKRLPCLQSRSRSVSREERFYRGRVSAPNQPL